MSASAHPESSGPPPPDTADVAMEIVCAKNNHQCLWLPANEIHEKLRVTFATTTNFSDTTLPVILFCPPMFGGRLLCVHVDHVAKKSGVRVVCADRPGMGGSTPVPLDIRVKVWLETVPVLLKHVQVSHVSLACHSAGTVFALNTLYHCRDILDPTAPYIGLIAPWVDNVYSQTALMNLASKLPAGITGKLSTVSKFVNQRVLPVTSWSAGIIMPSWNVFRSGEDSDATAAAEKYGVDAEVAQRIEKLSTQFFFEEDVSAGSEEAKLCLKKSEADLWGVCDDYATFAQLVKKSEKQRLDSVSESDSKVKLRIRAYFAESDIMIGETGHKYFDSCWEQSEESIQFDTAGLPDTNHETILSDRKKGALGLVFEEVHKLHAQSKIGP